jgi:hypothetical protein
VKKADPVRFHKGEEQIPVDSIEFQDPLFPLGEIERSKAFYKILESVST